MTGKSEGPTFVVKQEDSHIVDERNDSGKEMRKVGSFTISPELARKLAKIEVKKPRGGDRKVLAGGQVGENGKQVTDINLFNVQALQEAWREVERIQTRR